MKTMYESYLELSEKLNSIETHLEKEKAKKILKLLLEKNNLNVSPDDLENLDVLEAKLKENLNSKNYLQEIRNDYLNKIRNL